MDYLHTLPDITTLPYALYRAEQVRHFDQIAIETFQIPGYELMQRAGSAAFALMQTRWPHAKRIIVLAGLGNNAGDGYIVAKLAHQTGLLVSVYQLGNPEKITGSARNALDDLQHENVPIMPFDLQTLFPPNTDVLIDAILGTGLEREITGLWAKAIAQMNAHPAPTLALDIASGIHSDTGAVLGCAVKAEVSISFIGLKQGMFTGAATDYVGKILFDSLNVPAKVYAHEILSAARINWGKCRHLLPSRNKNSHKGQFGHVLVIGGDHGMGGAGRMAAEAALRTGAGLVSLACRPAYCAPLMAARPEIMCHAIEDPSDIHPLLTQASVIAIGPGLGRSAWGKALFECVMAECQHTDKPMVIDADALHCLAQHDDVCREHWVLTPHPGEAAHLLQQDTRTIQQDRFTAAQKLQQRYGGAVVLKGCGSIVYEANKPYSICDEGNPGMASGGMGDVLTGVIASLLAQGLSVAEAAKAGVSVHARAGDLAAEQGQRGLLATDLLPHIRTLVNQAC